MRFETLEKRDVSTSEQPRRLTESNASIAR